MSDERNGVADRLIRRSRIHQIEIDVDQLSAVTTKRRLRLGTRKSRRPPQGPRSPHQGSRWKPMMEGRHSTLLRLGSKQSTRVPKACQPLGDQVCATRRKSALRNSRATPVGFRFAATTATATLCFVSVTMAVIQKAPAPVSALSLITSEWHRPKIPTACVPPPFWPPIAGRRWSRLDRGVSVQPSPIFSCAARWR